MSQVTGLFHSQEERTVSGEVAGTGSYSRLLTTDCIADTFLAVTSSTAARHSRASRLLITRLLHAGPDWGGDAAGGVGGPVGPGGAHGAGVVQTLHGATVSLEAARVVVDEQ